MLSVQATIPGIPPHPHNILGWIQPHPKKNNPMRDPNSAPIQPQVLFFLRGHGTFIYLISEFSQKFFFRCRFVDFPLVLVKVYHLT